MGRKILKATCALETIKYGYELGSLLLPGDVVLLKGDLGAGKTHFAKGIGKALEIKEEISSPTFNILKTYSSFIQFNHIDCYRLKSSEEGVAAGLGECFLGDSITVIEWPEILGEIIEGKIIEVTFNIIGDEREIIIDGDLDEGTWNREQH